MTWADVEQIGKVRRDRDRGWHIDFRSVHWPGAPKPRRIRVTKAPGYGRFDTEYEARKAHLQIQSRLLDGKPLYDVLAPYLDIETPENTVLYRWNHDFLPEQARKHKRGKLSRQRKRELERYEGRGHLDFWKKISLFSINEGLLWRWLAWLEETYPALGPRTLKHLIADFGTFLRYEQRLGVIADMPKLPTVEVPDHQKKVPEPYDLGRILDAIPAEVRGLWLARSLAGLRPTEARRLDVHDYDFGSGVLTIPAEKSKTKKFRLLPIRDVVQTLDSWLCNYRGDAMGAEPLFINPNARNPERRWLEHPERNVWVAALKSAGVEHVKPNEGGRHAFITNQIAEGTDPYAVKDWAGHTSLQTTEGYKSVTAVTLARRMRRRSGPIVDQAQEPVRKTQ